MYLWAWGGGGQAFRVLFLGPAAMSAPRRSAMLPLTLLALAATPASALQLTTPAIDLRSPSTALAACRPRAPPPTANALADAAYTVGLLAVVGLVARSVFDSVFIENDATTPDKPAFKLPNPFGGARDAADPILEAERIRAALQAADQAGDIETAYKLEKELKQFLWENNVVYEVDVQPARRGMRIEELKSGGGSSVMGSENSYERDQMLRDLE